MYRPPNSSSSIFLKEFEDFLEFPLDFQHHVILGDFNVHFESIADSFACSFRDLTEHYCYAQHVFEPTHNGGHTLDLIFSRSNEMLVSSVVVQDLSLIHI